MYLELEGKGSYLHYTMFQSQGHRRKQVYWTYKKITFRGLL